MDKTKRRALRGAAQALQEFQRYQTDIPLSRIQALIVVAQNPGITTSELAPLVKLTSRAAAEAVGILGTDGVKVPGKRERVGGWGLLTAVRDPEDHRRKRLWLSPAGHALVKRAAALMG